jgi:betaine-aldehyde dehydrogenase
VTGAGSDVGTALAGHPDVDLVTFTGSTAVGRKVMAAAAVQGHRVQLELGGKAPFVVFDDADLDAAIQGAVAGALINTGQDCTAATRAIVARELYDDFVAGVGEVMGKVVVGDPKDADTDLGPLISMAHREKVAAMVARAPGQGGRIVTGGSAPDRPGSFYRPTLIADVDERSEVYRDEIFGPVLTVRTFTDDDDALRQANDTEYGLAASAWTRDVYRAQRASREIKAGCVWINDHIPIISEMPHGGVGASGFGKDMSDYSLEEYLTIKHVMSDITGVADKGWHRTIFTKR